MTAVVNVHEAKTHFSKLIDRAHMGEEIILAKAGKPWAKIVPIEIKPKQKRQPGGLKIVGDISDSVWFDPLPDDELDLWEGKHKDYL